MENFQNKKMLFSYKQTVENHKNHYNRKESTYRLSITKLKKICPGAAPDQKNKFVLKNITTKNFGFSKISLQAVQVKV